MVRNKQHTMFATNLLRNQQYGWNIAIRVENPPIRR